jgi:hypothetical protein
MVFIQEMAITTTLDKAENHDIVDSPLIKGDTSRILKGVVSAVLPCEIDIAMRNRLIIRYC